MGCASAKQPGAGGVPTPQAVVVQASQPAPPHSTPPLRMEHSTCGIPCSSNCGWSAFPGFAKCCRSCSGPEGPHSSDCAIKNRRVQALCERGCGRFAFASFPTCCTRCMGPDGDHTRDCAAKGSRPPQASVVAAQPQLSPQSNRPHRSAAARSEARSEVEESLRGQLAYWHDGAGAMGASQNQELLVKTLGAESGLEPQAVRVLWMSVARSTRAVGGPMDAYVDLAKRLQREPLV